MVIPQPTLKYPPSITVQASPHWFWKSADAKKKTQKNKKASSVQIPGVHVFEGKADGLTSVGYTLKTSMYYFPKDKDKKPLSLASERQSRLVSPGDSALAERVGGRPRTQKTSSQNG